MQILFCTVITVFWFSLNYSITQLWWGANEKQFQFIIIVIQYMYFNSVNTPFFLDYRINWNWLLCDPEFVISLFGVTMFYCGSSSEISERVPWCVTLYTWWWPDSVLGWEPPGWWVCHVCGAPASCPVQPESGAMSRSHWILPRNLDSAKLPM